MYRSKAEVTNYVTVIRSFLIGKAKAFISATQAITKSFENKT